MKKTLGIVSIVLTLAVAVIGWILLPESVAMEYNEAGEVTKYMSKITVILLPATIGCVGGYMSLQQNKANRFKGVTLTVLGIAILVVMLLFSR